MRQRALEIKLFYLHSWLFVDVNVLPVIIDLAIESGSWFYWSLIGWGAGLGVHASTVYLPLFEEGWYEQKTRELLESNGSIFAIPAALWRWRERNPPTFVGCPRATSQT